MISVGLLSFGFQSPATAPMAPSRSSVQMSKVGRNPGIEKLQVSNRQRFAGWLQLVCVFHGPRDSSIVGAQRYMARRPAAHAKEMRCLSRVPLLPPGRLDTLPEIGGRLALLEKNPDAQPIISLALGHHDAGSATLTVSPPAPPSSAPRRATTTAPSRVRCPARRSRPTCTTTASTCRRFSSDGSKCDIGRLQMMFGSGVNAVQDPSCPVYATPR